MKIFDAGASPVPLLLLRAMGFLGTLVGAYVPLQQAAAAVSSGDTGASNSDGDATSAAAAAAVLRTLRETELFGIVSVLVSILLSEGRREKPQGTQPTLPQTVISMSVQAVRLLNNVARMDLATLQETLGACRQQEVYHLMVCLFDYCSSRLAASRLNQAVQGQDESDLLHETIVLLGYYCLQCKQNQGIMCYGEGQLLLAKIASLDLHYFMDERGRSVLFPTILAACFQSEQNLAVLRNEMDVKLLRTYIIAQQASARERDECPLALRFPQHLWQEALEFFTDDADEGV